MKRTSCDDHHPFKPDCPACQKAILPPVNIAEELNKLKSQYEKGLKESKDQKYGFIDNGEPEYKSGYESCLESVIEDIDNLLKRL